MFLVTKKGTDAEVSKFDGNASLPSINFSELSQKSRYSENGKNRRRRLSCHYRWSGKRRGVLESHGRWLPYPILVPMMVGTAMSLEKEYYSADASFEIGRLSQQTLQGDFSAKERIRAFYWAAHQLARKMNLMQMAELTQSCPNLQNVFDLAALIRMRNRPVSEAIGKIKFAQREMGFLPLDQRDQAEADLKRLVEERKVVEKIFEREMQIIYAGTLLSGNPEGIYRFVKQYPVYDKGGDKDALQSLHWRISKLPCLMELALSIICSRRTNQFTKRIYSHLLFLLFSPSWVEIY